MAQIITTLNISAPKTLAIDEVNANTTYIGVSKVGASTSDSVWQIRKVDKTGTETRFLYADGDERYDNKWTDRAILSYS